MIQTLAAYAIVAVAASWAVWSLLLRGFIRRRTKSPCSDDCVCGS